MPYTRRIIHYAADAETQIDVLTDRAIAGCWFELLRQGGCGTGELTLKDAFAEREAVSIGDWLAFEYDTGERWYLGRVESRRAVSPAGVTFALEGMSIELRDVFPGGFNRAAADGTPPHRYGQTDLFSYDPDYSDETLDSLNEPHELVSLLLDQYVGPQTHIAWTAENIEAATHVSSIGSVKFRGEDSVWSILHELALRSDHVAWGVDEQGQFFFLKPRSALMASYREGVDVLSLTEIQDRQQIFNRVLLTGDYIYGPPVGDAVGTRNAHRWRGNYIETASRATYGDRRIQIHVPWIRSQTDAREFITEFFRIYAEPTSRYRLEVRGESAVLRPWEGRVELLAKDGSVLIRSEVHRLRIEFDRAPRFLLELGPPDPRALWPASSTLDRWELPLIPAAGEGGELISLTDQTDADVSGEGEFIDTPCCDQVPAELSIKFRPTEEEIALTYSPVSGFWETAGTLPMLGSSDDWTFSFKCIGNRWQLSSSNNAGETASLTYPVPVCPLTSITFSGNETGNVVSFSHDVRAE